MSSWLLVCSQCLSRKLHTSFPVSHDEKRNLDQYFLVQKERNCLLAIFCSQISQEDRKRRANPSEWLREEGSTLKLFILDFQTCDCIGIAQSHIAGTHILPIDIFHHMCVLLSVQSITIWEGKKGLYDLVTKALRKVPLNYVA